MSRLEANLSARPFTELSKRLLSFLIFYERTREKIPSESRWFTRKMIHRDWYRTDDDRVSIAHQTRTTLDPDSIPNRSWLEDQLLPIIGRCITTNLTDRQPELVSELLPYYDAYIKSVSELLPVSKTPS
jgi:hypothetical protein